MAAKYVIELAKHHNCLKEYEPKSKLFDHEIHYQPIHQSKFPNTKFVRFSSCFSITPKIVTIIEIGIEVQ